MRTPGVPGLVPGKACRTARPALDKRGVQGLARGVRTCRAKPAEAARPASTSRESSGVHVESRTCLGKACKAARPASQVACPGRQAREESRGAQPEPGLPGKACRDGAALPSTSRLSWPGQGQGGVPERALTLDPGPCPGKACRDGAPALDKSPVLAGQAREESGARDWSPGLVRAKPAGTARPVVDFRGAPRYNGTAPCARATRQPHHRGRTS